MLKKLLLITILLASAIWSLQGCGATLQKPIYCVVLGDYVTRNVLVARVIRVEQDNGITPYSKSYDQTKMIYLTVIGMDSELLIGNIFKFEIPDYDPPITATINVQEIK